jgi:competence ComEA-like helix-hairpin-helix protein
MVRSSKYACAAGFLAMALIPLSAQEKQDKEGKDLPDGPGKNLTIEVCGGCHPLAMVTRRGRSKEEWQNTIIAMVKKGADASDDQFQAINEYLALHFGPKSEEAGKVNVNKADSTRLAAFFEIPASQAQAIVRHRESKGPFKEWKELQKVPGIDAAKVEARKDRMEF